MTEKITIKDFHSLVLDRMMTMKNPTIVTSSKDPKVISQLQSLRRKYRVPYIECRMVDPATLNYMQEVVSFVLAIDVEYDTQEANVCLALYNAGALLWLVNEEADTRFNGTNDWSVMGPIDGLLGFLNKAFRISRRGGIT